jgi:hypothetical protein
MLDESWFYFSTDHERICLAPGETAVIVSLGDWIMCCCLSGTSFPKGNQIQRQGLYNDNTAADQRLTPKRGSSPCSKIEYPSGQCKTTDGQSIDEFHGGQHGDKSTTSAIFTCVSSIWLLSIRRPANEG